MLAIFIFDSRINQSYESLNHWEKKSSNRRWNSELVLIVSVDIRSVGRSLESLYKLDTLLLALSLITQWVPDEFKKWTWSDFNLDASSDLESLPKLTPLQVRKECKSFQHYWIQHCWLRILNGAVEIDGEWVATCCLLEPVALVLSSVSLFLSTNCIYFTVITRSIEGFRSEFTANL